MSINEQSVDSEVLSRIISRAALEIISTAMYQASESGDGTENELVEHGWLPAKYSRIYTDDFLYAFAACTSSVLGKIGSEHQQMLTCTAEELAFRAIVHVASMALSGKEPYFWSRPEIKTLMKGQRRDRLRDKLAKFDELAIEDRDVDFLFDMQHDGIEDESASPDVTVNPMGLANLHPRDWFSPFRPDMPVAREALVHAGPWLKWLNAEMPPR